MNKEKREIPKKKKIYISRKEQIYTTRRMAVACASALAHQAEGMEGHGRFAEAASLYFKAAHLLRAQSNSCVYRSVLVFEDEYRSRALACMRRSPASLKALAELQVYNQSTTEKGHHLHLYPTKTPLAPDTSLQAALDNCQRLTSGALDFVAAHATGKLQALVIEDNQKCSHPSSSGADADADASASASAPDLPSSSCTDAQPRDVKTLLWQIEDLRSENDALEAVRTTADPKAASGTLVLCSQHSQVCFRFFF
jgi:hypothetical protein